MNDVSKSCGCHQGCSPGTGSVSTERAAEHDAGEFESRWTIPKMDCPSEERMIRLALEPLPGVRSLAFDLPGRQLRVIHDGPVDSLTSALLPLGLGARLDVTKPADDQARAEGLRATQAANSESGVLRTLLLINAGMFLAELGVGWLAQSTGLIADAMDMFADAAVYGVALFAVGRGVTRQLQAARMAGLLQMVLAVAVLLDVLRRFVWGSEPESGLMMVMSALALLANVTCLMLISRHRDGGAHMKASWIFSANDVIINVGVILAGGLVALTGSAYPDLIIGTVVALIVLNGARRILALKG